MAIFAEVAQVGSMAAAARRLGLTTSAVSQSVRRLEQRFSVVLLIRTTRRMRLTEAGADFLGGCEAMLAGARRAMDVALIQRLAPRGKLRIAAPPGMGRLLAVVLSPLLQQHPELSLVLHLDDRPIDLATAECDFAIRVGPIADGPWIARRLGKLPVALMASPSYLERVAWNCDPARLEELDWLAFDQHAQRGLAFELTTHGGCRRVVRPHKRCIRVTASKQEALVSFAIAGAGVAVVIGPEIETVSKSGSLTAILPDWNLPPLPVTALLPSKAPHPQKVRIGLAVLRAWFRSGVFR